MFVILYVPILEKVRFNPLFYFVFPSNLKNNLMLLFQAPTRRRIIALWILHLLLTITIPDTLTICSYVNNIQKNTLLIHLPSKVHSAQLTKCVIERMIATYSILRKKKVGEAGVLLLLSLFFLSLHSLRCSPRMYQIEIMNELHNLPCFYNNNWREDSDTP